MQRGTHLCDFHHGESAVNGFTCQDRMKARGKSVAGVIVIALLITPAVAEGSCARSMYPIIADSGMAMPEMPPAGTEFSNVSVSRCCLDSPAEVTPSLVAAKEVAAVSVSTSDAPRSARPITPVVENGTFRVKSPPAQAFLCVFLI